MDENLQFSNPTISDIFAEKKFSKVGKVRSSRDANRRKPRLLTEFSRDTLAKLYLLANDDTVVDNNERADYIADLIEPMGFVELGRGTNRVSFRKDGYVFKIALDRRGFIDNMSEYFRSIEYPQYLAKVYECNRTIIVMEYVNLMAEDEFDDNKDNIKKILDNLSISYVMDDLGLTKKNYCNWGYRHGGGIVALDYAYLYPIKGNESVMVCSCGGDIVPNSSYTGYKCSNSKCGLTYTASELHNHMRVRDSVDDAVLEIVGKDKKLYIQSDGDIELMNDDEVREMREQRQKLLDEAKHTPEANSVNGSTPLMDAIKGLQSQQRKVESIFSNMLELPQEMQPDTSGVSQNEFMSMLEQYNLIASSNSAAEDDDDEDDE